jgi:hypothetical protein
MGKTEFQNLKDLGEKALLRSLACFQGLPDKIKHFYSASY